MGWLLASPFRRKATKLRHGLELCAQSVAQANPSSKRKRERLDGTVHVSPARSAILSAGFESTLRWRISSSSHPYCLKKRWYPTIFIEKYAIGVLSERVVKCGFWLQKKDFRKGATLFPTHFLTAKEMQGYLMAAKEDGALVFRWRHPDGSKRTLSLCARFAVSRGNRDSRALSFTKHGIDIADAKGERVRSSNTWNEGSSQASFPKSEFNSRPSGQLLVDFRTTVRQECGHEVMKEGLPKTGKKWGAPGQKYLAGNATMEQIRRQNCPPLDNDANFLLVAFLDERFPDGGILRTAPKAKLEDSTEDLQVYIHLCKRPEFSYHPYSSIWVGLLDRDTPLVGLLGKHIQVYRTCRSDRPNCWSSNRKKWSVKSDSSSNRNTPEGAQAECPNVRDCRFLRATMNPNLPQRSILLYVINARIGDRDNAHPSHRQISGKTHSEGKLTANYCNPHAICGGSTCHANVWKRKPKKRRLDL